MWASSHFVCTLSPRAADLGDMIGTRGEYRLKTP